MRTQDIDLAGRYSEWEYYNSDHAFIAGKKAAEKVSAALAQKSRVVAVNRKSSQSLAITLATAS